MTNNLLLKTRESITTLRNKIVELSQRHAENDTLSSTEERQRNKADRNFVRYTVKETSYEVNKGNIKSNRVLEEEQRLEELGFVRAY